MSDAGATSRTVRLNRRAKTRGEANALATGTGPVRHRAGGAVSTPCRSESCRVHHVAEWLWLERRILQLERALRPFVDAAIDTDSVGRFWLDTARSLIGKSDFRRAARALGKAKR